MKQVKPLTRTDAAAPAETKHLSSGQKAALEHGEEAEHSIGPEKERLIDRATKLAKRKGR